jgi:hypothetical protein
MVLLSLGSMITLDIEKLAKEQRRRDGELVKEHLQLPGDELGDLGELVGEK